MARYLVLVNHEKNEYFPEKCACCTLKNYYKTENILHRACDIGRNYFLGLSGYWIGICGFWCMGYRSAAAIQHSH